MIYIVEFSQIVRQKMKILKMYLNEQFGAETAQKILKQIMESARNLAVYPQQGIRISSLFDVDTDFRCLYVKHNYLFYYIDDNKVIVSEMFDEREDFMFKLFGIKSVSDSEDDLK